MKTVSLLQFGAVADGVTDNSLAFQQAFAAVAGTSACLEIPSGIYLSGPLDIPSHTHIHFQDGAVVRFYDAFDCFPPVASRWEGVDCYCMHPLVFINDAEDVSITGNGVFDGNGQKWWDYILPRKHDQKEPMIAVEKALAQLNPTYKTQPGGGGGRQCQFLRPPLMQVRNSKHIVLGGFRLTQSPFWTLHLVCSEYVQIEGVSIKNPADSPNTDGMDIESSGHITIEDCIVDVGDDGICLKSGSGRPGIEAAKPTYDVTVRHATVKNAHGGFVIGSETAAGFHDITVDHCLFEGTDRGIRIKTRRGRGGHIHGIKIADVTMKNTICPLTINMFYRCGGDDPLLYSLAAQPVTDETPCIEDIDIERCTATESRACAGFIVGLPEAPIRNLHVKDCSFAVQDKIESGLEIEMCSGIPQSDYRGIRLLNAECSFENVSVNVQPAWCDEGCSK